jgi:hypothetical protein
MDWSRDAQADGAFSRQNGLSMTLVCHQLLSFAHANTARNKRQDDLRRLRPGLIVAGTCSNFS